MTFTTRKALLGCGAALMALSLGSQALAQQRTFDIPAQDAATAIGQFGLQAGVQITAPTDKLRGVRTRPLQGAMDARQALSLLLQGTGLEIASDNGSVIVLRRAAGPQEPAAQLEEVIVTGTRIRGGVIASPRITIGEKQFKEEGFTDLGEVIRSIPQNFRGGQNPGMAAGAAGGGNANQDMTGGSGLNLRGLGPDATLTLLNGRRLSYDGLYGAVDVSAIPIEAVEHLEIVPDGASAVYGSDAVGGVANVVLKRDFTGLTIGALRGFSSEGGLARTDYTATSGAKWSSGGFIATYIHSDRDPIFADQRSYTAAMYSPTTLFNGSAQSSGLISAHQNIGDNVELRVDAIRNVRNLENYNARQNYYYVDERRTDTNVISPGVQFLINNDWKISAGGSYGRSKNVSNLSTVNGGNRILSSSSCYCNKTTTWDLSASGPLLRFSDRQVQVAVGVGGRRDAFESRSLISPAGYGGSERSRYAYAEVSVPFIDSANARPGIRRLELNIAARSENYQTFGSVTTPRVGMIYEPNRDITLKTSWGKSFKAPALSERYYNRASYLYGARAYGCPSCAADQTILMSYGGNPNLKPERARTWSGTVVFHPHYAPALNVELSYFNISYKGRITQPIANYANLLGDPSNGYYVHYNPTAQQLNDTLSTYGGTFNNYTSSSYDPTKVVAIVSGQYANVSEQRAQGLDLNGSYGFDLGVSKVMLRGGLSWLDLSQRNGAGEEYFDLSGMIYRPAEFNGRLGAVWSQGGMYASLFANYTSGVTARLINETDKSASFTTFDTVVRYEFGGHSRISSGLVLAASVTNIFDRRPPLSPPVNSNYSRYVPYDPTNYSAVGRYMTVSVSKHF